MCTLIYCIIFWKGFNLILMILNLCGLIKETQKSKQRKDARETLWEHRNPIVAWVRLKIEIKEESIINSQFY